jgi:BRCA1-associated protein
MRGYHIHIIVQQKTQISSYQPQAADTFIPSHLFQHLPAHKPRSTRRQNATFNSQNKDYRFGPVRVDWMDFENMSRASYSAVGKEKDHGRGMPGSTCSFDGHLEN